MTDRREFLIRSASVVAALAVPGAAGRLRAAERAPAREMVIRKNRGCMCCDRWAAHLEENGIATRIEAHPDLNGHKREAGVPEDLWSCHTGSIDGYLVEGHVPAEDVLRMLETRPEIRGIAVPGMPVGSPGMEVGDRVDAYEVIAFGGDDGPFVFASHG